MKNHFPIWKHHAIHKDKLVKSQEHLNSLGEGWGDDSSVWRTELVEKDHDEIETIKVEDDQLSMEVEESKPKHGKKHASKKIGV